MSPPRRRTEGAILKELEKLIPTIDRAEAARTKRDELLVELVVRHEWSRQRAADYGRVSRAWVGRLVDAAITAEAPVA